MAPSWAHEYTIDLIREQMRSRLRELGLRAVTGKLHLPGVGSFYVPDLAVVPAALARTDGALLPEQTELLVEVTSPSNRLNDHVVKCADYGRSGAPRYLLVDRQKRFCVLYFQPSGSGYARADGPYGFGVSMDLGWPFDMSLDTREF